MRLTDLYSMSVAQLEGLLRDRLWLGRGFYDTPFHQDAHDLFVDAWHEGDDAFRSHLDQAIARVLKDSACAVGAFRDPRPILPLVIAVEPSRAAGPLAVLVEDLEHNDCLGSREIARYHTELMLALDASQAKGRASLWIEQLDRALRNGGAAACARVALSVVAFEVPEVAVARVAEVARVSAAEGEREALEDVFRPLLAEHQGDPAFAERVGHACGCLTAHERSALRQAVAAVSEGGLAEAFARGAGLSASVAARSRRPDLQWLRAPREHSAHIQIKQDAWAPLVPR